MNSWNFVGTPPIYRDDYCYGVLISDSVIGLYKDNGMSIIFYMQSIDDNGNFEGKFKIYTDDSEQFIVTQEIIAWHYLPKLPNGL